MTKEINRIGIGIAECKYCDRLKKENEELKALFNDDYFKGLDNKTVIELAKKSIRITAYNREFEDKLEKIKDLCEVITTIPDEFCGIKNVYQADSLDELAEKIKKIIEEK